MKTIGLIGGMSWESTVMYYQLLNRQARDQLGGLHSAKLVMWSFDFAEIEEHQASGDWDAAADMMIDAAKRLESAGAQCLVICTNTMHKLAAEVSAAVNIPLIHIADATATAIKSTAVSRPLLLATKYTMEQDFYKGHLRDKHGIDVLVPDRNGRSAVHDIIYDELCRGEISAASKEKFLEVVGQAVREHAIDGVIFGCTEVALLIGPEDFDIHTFNTTELHAGAALDFALGQATGAAARPPLSRSIPHAGR